MKNLMVTLVLITGLILNLKAQEASKSAPEKEVIISGIKPVSPLTMIKNEHGGASGGVVNVLGNPSNLLKKGYDSYKAQSDMANARTVVNPLFKRQTTIEETAKSTPKDISSTQRRRVEVLKSNKTGDPSANK